jgi:hypothetical protein
MPGWAIAAVIVAVAALLFWLAWWSSGRAKPLVPGRGEKSNDELRVEAEIRSRLPGMSGPGAG